MKKPHLAIASVCLSLAACTLAPSSSPSGVRSPIGSMQAPEKYLRDFPLGVSQDELINYLGPTDSISTIGDTTYIKVDLAKKQGTGGLGVSPGMYVAVYTYVIKNGKVDNVTYQNNGLFGRMQNLDAKTEKAKG